ncbi:VOC family protein [Rhodovulum sp. FJ3]|nr:VOC family protein [Rhodovulum sp. FJ3]
MMQLTPFLPVRDVEEAVRFYEAVLGFKCTARRAGYAHLKRDQVALRIISAAAGKDMGSPDSQLHLYVDVDDVDQLYNELKEALSELPENRCKPLFNTTYGRREFHVIDNDVTLISFGSPQKREFE